MGVVPPLLGTRGERAVGATTEGGDATGMTVVPREVVIAGWDGVRRVSGVGGVGGGNASRSVRTGDAGDVPEAGRRSLSLPGGTSRDTTPLTAGAPL
jgi:hypothetical protein